MIDFIRARIQSISHALAGWKFVLNNEKNTWVHAVASICVILMGIWLQLSTHDWALIILVIALVWVTEFINTSIEAVVDLASPAHHPLAKVGKDVGAAAVLIAASAAVLVGLLILGPPLVSKIFLTLRP